MQSTKNFIALFGNERITKLKRLALINDIEYGGLKMLDIESIDSSAKNNLFEEVY